MAGRVGRVPGPRGRAGGARDGDRAGAGPGLPGAGAGGWRARALPAHRRVHDRRARPVRAARLPARPGLRLRRHPPPGPPRRPARPHPVLPARPHRAPPASAPRAGDARPVHPRRRAVREPGHRGTRGRARRAPGGQRPPAGRRPVPPPRRFGRGCRPRPLHAAVLAREVGDPIRFTSPPRLVQRALSGVLAPVAWAAGRRALDPDHLDRELPIVDLDPLPEELAGRVPGLAGQHTGSA